MKDKNQRLGLNILMIVVGMVMLTYASVPLYKTFCRVTGYGGTPLIAEKLIHKATDRVVTIRFDSNIDPKLPWKFKPEKLSEQIRVGESSLAFFDAENLTDKPITGMAAYNVSPDKAAPYFNKVQCFCFNEQTLAPHQKVQMPVSYFVDPDFNKDPQMRDVDTITLSYTFYLVEKK